MFRFGKKDDEEKFHDASEAFLHPDSAEEGGIACKNKKLIEQQRGAIMEMVKEMGKKLLMGNPNLMSISMPVKLFEARSYLQKLTDVWVFPEYLNRAAQPGLDPIERMKLTVTFIMAGFQFAFASWSKPFNPILGETWEATLSDGTRIFMEQISHHPPISAFQVIGKDGLWEFDGMSEPAVSYKGNSLKTKAKGYRIVRFRDGDQIEIFYPSYYLRGVMYGSEPRGEITGECTFVDRKNALYCSVSFGAIKSAIDPNLRRSDAISGVLVKDASLVAQSIKLGDGRSPPPHRPSNPRIPAIDPSKFPPPNPTHPDAPGASPKSPGQVGNSTNLGNLPPSVSTPNLPSALKSVHLEDPDCMANNATDSPTQSNGSRAAAQHYMSKNNDNYLSRGSLGSSIDDDLPSPSSRPHLPSVFNNRGLATLTGSWLSHLDWDGKRYWTLDSDPADHWKSAESQLQSDCRFREDLAYLHKGNREESQKWKEALEVKQRRDAKLRKGLA